MNLSFAGCGFLGIYHIGVACCFRKYCPQLLLNKISGASIGAISACCLLCDLPLGKYVVYANICVWHVYKLFLCTICCCYFRTRKLINATLNDVHFCFENTQNFDLPSSRAFFNNIFFMTVSRKKNYFPSIKYDRAIKLCTEITFMNICVNYWLNTRIPYAASKLPKIDVFKILFSIKNSI